MSILDEIVIPPDVQEWKPKKYRKRTPAAPATPDEPWIRNGKIDFSTPDVPATPPSTDTVSKQEYDQLKRENDRLKQRNKQLHETIACNQESYESRKNLYKMIQNIMQSQIDELKAAGTSDLTPEMLKKIINLCHPDKHNGKQSATDVTTWLLSQRK